MPERLVVFHSACQATAIVASLCALLSGCLSSTRPAEQETVPADPIARFEGRWVQRGPYNIIGAGIDEVATIARDGDGWTIAFTLVRHPSVNEKSRELTRVEYAPAPLEWEDGCLAYTDPRRPGLRTQRTVDIVGERMLLPAVVQRDERTWEFRGDHERDSFQCEHDPRVVPTGTAVQSRAAYPQLPSHYRMTEASSLAKQGTLAPCLQFFQIAPDGSEHVCAQLMLEREPWGIYVRFGDSWSGYAGDGWDRLSDADWLALQAIRLVQPP